MCIGKAKVYVTSQAKTISSNFLSETKEQILLLYRHERKRVVILSPHPRWNFGKYIAANLSSNSFVRFFLQHTLWWRRRVGFPFILSPLWLTLERAHKCSSMKMPIKSWFFPLTNTADQMESSEIRGHVFVTPNSWLSMNACSPTVFLGAKGPFRCLI